MQSRRSAIAVVIGLTLLSGVVHGYLDGRWSVAADMTAQGKLLETIPTVCGDWEMVDSSDLDPNAAELLRCYGLANRTYRNLKTNDVIKVVVLFGPRGPIAVHTPEICYDSVGTKQSRERLVETISTPNHRHQLWSVQFARSGESDPHLEVWYAWSKGQEWNAAENPRFWMTDSLYKVQLAGPVSRGNDQPCRDFLETFLRQVEQVVQ